MTKPAQKPSAPNVNSRVIPRRYEHIMNAHMAVYHVLKYSFMAAVIAAPIYGLYSLMAPEIRQKQADPGYSKQVNAMNNPSGNLITVCVPKGKRFEKTGEMRLWGIFPRELGTMHRGPTCPDPVTEETNTAEEKAAPPAPAAATPPARKQPVPAANRQVTIIQQPR